MNDVKKELDEMFNALSVNTAAPATNAPGTSAPGTSAPSTNAPGTDAPSTDSASTDAPATEAPTTDVPEDDEFVQMRAENALLKSRLDKLEKPSTDTPGTQAPSTDAPIGEEDFVGDLDLDDLTRDSSKLNTLLNNVFKKGVELAREYARTGNERMALAVPDMVKNNIKLVTALNQASEKFYEDNKDLKPFKKVVALVFQEEAAKTPNKTYDEVLETVGPEVRTRLELQAKAVEKQTPNPNKGPKLPRKKGGKLPNQKPATTGIQSEIDSMNEALET